MFEVITLWVVKNRVGKVCVFLYLAFWTGGGGKPANKPMNA